MNIRVFIAVIFIGIVHSCSNSEVKSNDEKVILSKQDKKLKKMEPYWVFLSHELSLSLKDLEEFKKLRTKQTKLVREQRKKKAWYGESNKENRNKIKKQHKAERKAFLKAEYKAWVKAHKQWGEIKKKKKKSK